MALSHELTPEEFYEATLANQGLLDNVREVTKEAEVKIAALAEERGLPVEVVKLAEAYYGQMDLDGLNYDDKVTQREDALKIAEAYYSHTQEVRAETVKVADAIMAAAMEAAEKVAAELGTDLNGFEAIKIAALQADTAQAFCDAQREEYQQWQECLERAKHAAVVAQARREMDPEWSEKVAALAPFPDPIRAEHVPIKDLASAVATSRGAAPNFDFADAGYENPLEYLTTSFGDRLSNVPAADHDKLFRNVGSAWSKAPHLGIDEVMAAELANFAPKAAPSAGAGDWMSKHKGKLLAGGLLGAGALYMLKKKRDEENRRREDELNMLRARALPPA